MNEAIFASAKGQELAEEVAPTKNSWGKALLLVENDQAGKEVTLASAEEQLYAEEDTPVSIHAEEEPRHWSRMTKLYSEEEQQVASFSEDMYTPSDS